MKLKSTFVAALLAAASAGSFAAISFDVDGTAAFGATPGNSSFTNVFTFDNLAAGTYEVDLSLSSQFISWTSGDLDGNPITFGPVSATSWYGYVTYTGSTPLTLTLKGIGSKAAANFTGEVSVSAVPEPETYAMLLAGLGLMGTIARRRSQKQVA